MEGKAPNVAVVIPCYNEEEVLPLTSRRLLEEMGRLKRCGKMAGESSLLFVDDGSRDGTWPVLEDLARREPAVAALKLSRNFGHQNALLAGLSSVDADAVISMDADLQDDLAGMEGMLDEHRKGRDVVYGVRRARNADTAWKRATARAFYRLLSLMGVDLVRDHADYRLISRRALEWLQEYREVDLFLRGIVPTITANCAIVYYDRQRRAGGKSKYSLRRMISFAWSGLTGFTAAPLRFVTLLGLFVSLASFLTAGWAFLVKYLSPHAVPGWASIVIPILCLGGVQILCIGIIGEYLGKIFAETKHRPRFLIEKRIP